MTVAAARVGVVVLNWRGEAETRRCLAALARQVGGPLDVLVVDNGSGRDEAERLQALAPTLALAENRGFAGGMNAGAAALLARGCSHLLLLNNDCELAPGAIAALLSAGADVAVPTLWHGRAPARTRCWYAGGRLGRWSLEPHHETRPPRAGAAPRPVTFATGCAWLVTAAAWRRLGGFEEGFFLYHEDVDASLRARAAGLSLAWVPAAEGWHVGGAATGGRGGRAPLVDYHDTRNGLAVIRRHRHGAGRLLALAWWGLVRLPRKVLRIALGGGPSRREALEAVRDGVRDGFHGVEGPWDTPASARLNMSVARTPERP
ncbi:MAG: glycosyltransferase [Candidatus Sericytochromatia bacterium]|nr:glycosyltransferase [Candidatus Sericytochromatia bacterium]